MKVKTSANNFQPAMTCFFSSSATASYYKATSTASTKYALNQLCILRPTSV